MGMTIAEKIISKYCGRDLVKPGDYVTLSDYVGPIIYSFKGGDNATSMLQLTQAIGVDGYKKLDHMIYNEDHNNPPQEAAVIEEFKQARASAEKLGMKVYAHEGIGHVVNVEQGDITPGCLFVHFDPQAANAGGIGALYTNGGRLGSSFIESMALGTLTIRVPETLRIVINGKLNPYVTGRDIWIYIQDLLGPAAAYGMVIEFAGSTVKGLSIEDRMILCGNVSYAGADTAIIAADEKTKQWYQEVAGIDVEMIDDDEDAQFERIIEIDAADIPVMVSVPPQIFTGKPASTLKGIKVDQCIIGTCLGGSIQDLRIIAKMLKGKKIADHVRMLVSPVTQKTYVRAVKEELLIPIAEAGATILPPTCDICLGVLGPLSDGEAGISQQTLNIPGRSGSMKADIYLASAATIAATALTGYITDPNEL